MSVRPKDWVNEEGERWRAWTRTEVAHCYSPSASRRPLYRPERGPSALVGTPNSGRGILGHHPKLGGPSSSRRLRTRWVEQRQRSHPNREREPRIDFRRAIEAIGAISGTRITGGGGLTVPLA